MKLSSKVLGVHHVLATKETFSQSNTSTCYTIAKCVKQLRRNGNDSHNVPSSFMYQEWNVAMCISV